MRRVAALAVVAVLLAAGVPPSASGAVRPAPSPGATTTAAPAADGGVATPAPENGTAPDDGTPAASGSSTATPGTTPATVTARTRTSPAGVTVTLFLNCTLLSVTVTPGDRFYYLRLAYRDGASGRRVRVAGGPFRGESEDHFGRTAFTLLSVVVRLQSGWTVVAHALRACLDEQESGGEGESGSTGGGG